MHAVVPSSDAVKTEEPEPESEVQQADADDSAYEFLGFFEEEPADESASSSAAQSTTSTNCPYCGIACASNFVLKHHLTVNHTYDIYNGKLLQCVSCKARKPGYAFIRHRSVATFSTACVVCVDVAEDEARRNRKAEARKRIDEQELAREGSVEHAKLCIARRVNSELKCPDCEFETSSKSFLFQHLAVAHGQMHLRRVKRSMGCRKCKQVQPGQKFVHFDEASRTFFITNVCMRCSLPQEVFIQCWKYAVPSVPKSRGAQREGCIIDLRRGNFEAVGEQHFWVKIPLGYLCGSLLRDLTTRAHLHKYPVYERACVFSEEDLTEHASAQPIL